MKTSKSTLTVARMALRAARDSLLDHAKAKSPNKFTQPQLMACLVVKELLQLDYRGPKPDPVEAKQTLHEALRHQYVVKLLGDAGYESEGENGDSHLLLLDVTRVDRWLTRFSHIALCPHPHRGDRNRPQQRQPRREQ